MNLDLLKFLKNDVKKFDLLFHFVKLLLLSNLLWSLYAVNRKNQK